MPQLLLNTPEGELEVRFSQAENPTAPMALLMHPHPEHGGTMNNKVVYTLYQLFVEQGFHVARFNFRGVGQSTGHFDFGEGELRDGVYVLNWMRTTFPKATEIWISGFSFGSWVALQLLKKNRDIQQFICAAPPVNVYDFNFMLPIDREGLFVQGTADTVVNPASSKELAEKISHMSQINVECHMIDDADHFFTGKLDQLTSITTDYIQRKRGSQ